MYTFRELQKASRMDVEGKEVRIAVLGNCATQFFSSAVQGYARQSGLNALVYDADYDQIDAQLLDRSSEVYAFRPDCIVIWLATDRLYEEFLDAEPAAREQFADRYMDKIERYWQLVTANCKADIIQFNFSEINDKALGNYSCKAASTFTYQTRRLNSLLGEAMARQGAVFPADLLSIQIELGQERFYDAPLYYNAKMTVAINALPYIAKAVTDVLLALDGRIKKCVVCDLDNTLWGGVIGDDGLGGIQIGELGQGHAFTNFQRWLKQLKDCGIILAVCSKNNEETAREPFEKHEEMVLRMGDISLFAANWDDKASNIKMIQKSLNIGMDSMVFLDDNPFERNLVRELIPEITVPELPQDPALYTRYLQRQNYFETASFAGAGADRTKQYQAEFERKKLEKTFESIDDYLISLEMKGTAKPFETVRFARIAQLTQRSNQFNLRTIRYTEKDIGRIAEDKNYLTLYYTLRDRFGDHGLVSVVIMKKMSETRLFIDTWLMSCRVLKRGMEEFIVNAFVDAAATNGFEWISAEYIPTPKNKMVEKIYETMGFTCTSGYHYELKVSGYVKKNNYITMED